MKRRTLLGAIFAGVGSATSGCLDDPSEMGESPDPGGNEVPTPTETPDASDGEDDPTATADADGISDTEIRVVGTDPDFDVGAAVAFGSDAITVTGTIRGNNTCYTARLGELSMADGTLSVDVESYEDAADDEGCGEAIIGIDYEAVVTFHQDRPSAVTVEHNGEQITSETAS